MPANFEKVRGLGGDAQVRADFLAQFAHSGRQVRWTGLTQGAKNALEGCLGSGFGVGVGVAPSRVIVFRVWGVALWRALGAGQRVFHVRPHAGWA